MTARATAPVRIVLAGGPGAGKTTLLRALAQRGWITAADAARDVIRERKARGLSPRPAPAEFAAEILRRDIDSYRSLDGARIAFERGVVDAVGALHQLGGMGAQERDRHLAAFPYFNPVFVLPPWREIYCQDDERDQTFEHAVAVFDVVVRWYRACGYQTLTVPVGSVAERCDFVVAEVAARG